MRFAWMLLVCLCACTPHVTDERQGFDPLLFVPEDIGRAKSVVIAIPGALTSIRVLIPIEWWRTSDRTIAYYRLPGFDDRPAEEPLSINAAASRIATFVRDGQFESVYFVGHSTGAAIALESAKAIRRTRPDTLIHVAGISTALPAPQPALVGWRGLKGASAAALRARSLVPREVWLEYYRRISYGPDASVHAETGNRADFLVQVNDDRIQLPKRGLGRRHFSAVLGWQNIDPTRLDGVQLDFWHGAVDPIFPVHHVSRFVDTLPNADLHVLDNHGHVIMLTYPDIWSEIATTWGFQPNTPD
ncbi:MAG: alpha/beta hydrolase [Paracoccaceae bacterium]